MTDTKYAGINQQTRPANKKWLILFTAGILFLIIVVICIVFAIRESTPPTPTYQKATLFDSAAVASDSAICSKVGATILKRGGNAIDSAIATVFCLGVVNLHSCGIGGGGFFVAYLRATKQFLVVDYREEAPASSSRDMYVNSTLSSTYGGSSVAIPGQVKGLWSLHKKYGHMNWSELLQPSIDLAEKGFAVTATIAHAISAIKSKLHSKAYQRVGKGLRELLTKKNGDMLQLGDTLRNPSLARTLRNIQVNNSKDMYEGELARRIVKDVNTMGGNISVEDLKNYQVRVREAVTLQLPGNLTLTGMGAPSGGPIVAMILNIMAGYDLSRTKLSNNDDSITYYQRVIESMKFAYAQRGYLGDPSFLPKLNVTKVMRKVSTRAYGDLLRQKISLSQTNKPSFYGGTWASKEDHGTAHLSVLAPNGDAVAVTETINLYFGSKVYSQDTGILYNDEMDDFSTPEKPNEFNYPPSPANFIRPGKRPLSSMSPVIVTDSSGNVRMVCGASGGSRIITGTAQALMKKLFLNMELGEAVDSYRFHHQGVPNELLYVRTDPYVPPKLLRDALEKIGHKLKSRKTPMSVVQAIYKDGGKIHAKCDLRKGGEPDGF